MPTWSCHTLHTQTQKTKQHCHHRQTEVRRHNTSHELNDTSHVHSFNNSHNVRPEALTAVLLRIQVFWNVLLCGWVDGSWNFQGLQYLQNMRKDSPNHKVSHPRTPEPSIHTNFLALFLQKVWDYDLFRGGDLEDDTAVILCASCFCRVP
jgi:hypothetical protein